MQVPNIDFMGRRMVASIFSGLMLVVAVVALGFNGLNMGLDFTGGTLLELGFDAPVDPEQIRTRLNSQGYENGTVQHFGSNQDVLIRMLCATRRRPNSVRR